MTYATVRTAWASTPGIRNVCPHRVQAALVNMMEVPSGCLLVRYACDLTISLKNIRQLVSFAALVGLIVLVIGAFELADES